MDRIQRYVLSTGNIVGSAGALAVTVSYLIGFIDGGWGLLALGAYVAGVLPFAFKETPAHMPESISTMDALDWLRRSATPKLPPKAKDILGQIIESVDGLMPRLKEMEQQGLVEASNRAMLKHAITRLLPDVVEDYLRLPPTYAKIKVLDGGKTPQALLIEQLDMLNAHVHTIADNLMSSDINSMLANSKFLEEKFRPGITLESDR